MMANVWLGTVKICIEIIIKNSFIWGLNINPRSKVYILTTIEFEFEK